MLLAAPARADDFFESRIRPLLAERCYECHAAKTGKSKGGLELDSRAAVLRGGDTAPAAVPGKPADSLLLKAARGDDPDVSVMPPKGPKLTPEQLRDLEKWIADGAKFPGDAPKETGPHWAFRPVAAPPIPAVKNAAWPRTDVDRFLLAKMEAGGVAPAPDAAPHAVARRLAFALTGLPPDADRPADVEVLLASPHFGERWARHWMDLVRYAEGAGHEYDYPIEGAWRYRDYLTRAFNADLPYNQFVREHVAGDLLPPRVVDGRNEALLATAWWHLHEAVTSPVDLAGDEADRLDNMLDTLGKTFNALTVGCARCHDHKFDPIRTREYYGLFGIAAASPAERAWANGPALEEYAAKLRAKRDAFDAKHPAPPPVPAASFDPKGGTVLADFAAGVPPGWRVVGHAEVVTPETAGRRGVPPGLWTGTLSRKLPALVRSPQFLVDSEFVDVLVRGDDATVQGIVGNFQLVRDPIYDGLRKRVKGDKLQWVRLNVGRWKGRRMHVEVFTGTADGTHHILSTKDTPSARFGLRGVVASNGEKPPTPEASVSAALAAAWRAEIADDEKAIPAPERFLAVAEAEGRDLPVNFRGDAGKPRGEPVPRRYLAALGDSPAPRTGSGRRELAEALASPTNPLTARVWVNRVWHHLFGRGLVPTVDNFGRLGEAPSHPELLDYLADRFVRVHHWSTKALIRELVTSRAFATASGPPPAADPENRLWSRYPLRRLDAESLRDAILAASGALDRAVGGEPVPVPHDLAKALTDSGNNAPPSGPADGHRRRSLYLEARRNYPSAFLDVFDRPPSQTTFGRRDVSNVPAQALALLNDPFVHGQAEAWAKRHDGVEADARVARMFVEAFGRPATPAERARARELAEATPGGWADLALALVNAKEFSYVP